MRVRKRVRTQLRLSRKIKPIRVLKMVKRTQTIRMLLKMALIGKNNKSNTNPYIMKLKKPRRFVSTALLRSPGSSKFTLMTAILCSTTKLSIKMGLFPISREYNRNWPRRMIWLKWRIINCFRGNTLINHVLRRMINVMNTSIRPKKSPNRSKVDMEPMKLTDSPLTSTMISSLTTKN